MIGTSLGSYRVVAELGSGGMGTVYLAEGDGQVALKVVHPHLVSRAGVFERYPKLKLIMTEQGSRWILDKLDQFEQHYSSDLFKYFGKDLTMSPTEYYRRQVFFGASMLSPRDCGLRHEIGVDKLMWGSDYPHLEGTWPHTMESLQATFAQVESDQEIRDILGLNAAKVFGFDVEALNKIADRIGPSLDEVRGVA